MRPVFLLQSARQKTKMVAVVALLVLSPALAPAIAVAEAVAAPVAKPIPVPQTLILPWSEIGISREAVVLAKKATDSARKTLIEVAIPGAIPLTKVASPKMPPTLNLLAAKIMVAPEGAVPGAPTVRSVTIAPVWCSLGDSYLFNLVAADTQKNSVLAHSAFRIKKTDWEKAEKAKSQVPIATATMTELYQDLKAQLAGLPAGATATDALHVGLALGRETTRRDEGSSLCLNLLVSGRLSRDYTVVNTVAGEAMAAIRFALDLPSDLRRPTRTVINTWEFPARKNISLSTPLTFPLQMKLSSQYAETVFGQSLEGPKESTWIFTAADNGRVSVGLDAGLVGFLNKEKAALSLADIPQAAKIYGAWVYLDRGRAFGLQMEDRLIGRSTGGAEVTGHIVGFFGPEMGLKSPRGYVINEGAIMFVRKGQHETALGQSFTFDPKKYPAAH